MAKDQLFLLKPDFQDQGRPWFCMACAAVEGFLGYYPAVRDQLDIAYVSYERPRDPIVALIGLEHQNAPVLVLAEPFDGPGLDDGDLRQAHGRFFVTNEGPVTRYLAARHGVSAPHP